MIAVNSFNRHHLPVPASPLLTNGKAKRRCWLRLNSRSSLFRPPRLAGDDQGVVLVKAAGRLGVNPVWHPYITILINIRLGRQPVCYPIVWHELGNCEPVEPSG
jgi:hypothetical protein